MDTDQLIRRLAENPKQVEPLPHPWARTVAWFSLAIPYIALVVFVVSPRNDLIVKSLDLRFLIEQFASLTTGIAAAVAAFASIIPGHNRRVLLIPLVPLAIWLGSLGQGCVQDWMQYGADGLTLRPDWFCFPAIVLVGAVPAIVMAAMLRRGAPLTPHMTTALGGLAAAGLGNFGLRLFHSQDASVMVLVWQLGTVFVLVGLAGWSGRYLLNWRSIIGAAPHGAAID